MRLRHQADRPKYSAAFYSGHKDGALKSAQVIVPWLIDLFDPHSVVDVGCGSGVWLSVFQKNGLGDFVGLDGTWVQPEQLEIPRENFRHVELSSPLNLERKFDLVVSLEVGEHLPHGKAAQFVSSLTSLGPVVVFSAAVPCQGGTGHVNEQWPDYWISLFKSEGYVAVDCLRGRFWHEDQVSPWYLQNTFCYVREDRLTSYPNVLEAGRKYSMNCEPLVHPRQFTLRVEELSNPDNYSLRKIATAAPRLVRRSLVGRLHRLMK